MEKRSRIKRHSLLVPAPQKGVQPIRQCLHVFKRLINQTHLKLAIKTTDLCFYDRIFTLSITLWYMIFQRLNHDHTLQAAVCDLHSGGADHLAGKKGKPPSKKIRSLATTAFSNARQRLPLALLSTVLGAQARDAWNAIQDDGKWRGLRVLLLDGSQLSLRAHPGILKDFTPSSNQYGPAYWVLMRVVATFCLHTGMAVASAVASATVSEQALAIQQILKNVEGCLYIGDRNFGVRQMVQCVLEASSHCLFRMTEIRAKKILGNTCQIRKPGDYTITWYPSKIDLKFDGCRQHAISGRLIVAQYTRPGFRSQWLYLFTTLLDATAFPASELIELYGFQWQVEINLRYLKTQMDLHQLDCKNKDMAQKEWLAGLMAYNLVRLTMSAAATANPSLPVRG